MRSRARSTWPAECGAGIIIVFGVQKRTAAGARGPCPGRGSPQAGRGDRAAGGAEARASRTSRDFTATRGPRRGRSSTRSGSPALGANWDPCNAFGTDEVPYPDGYAAVRPVIMNVHAKDTARGSLIQCVPIGEGAIDWAGQIRALVADRIVPHVTIETHCLPLVEQSAKNVRTLRSLIADAVHTQGS